MFIETSAAPGFTLGIASSSSWVGTMRNLKLTNVLTEDVLIDLPMLGFMNDVSDYQSSFDNFGVFFEDGVGPLVVDQYSPLTIIPESDITIDLSFSNAERVNFEQQEEKTNWIRTCGFPYTRTATEVSVAVPFNQTQGSVIISFSGSGTIFRAEGDEFVLSYEGEMFELYINGSLYQSSEFQISEYSRVALVWEGGSYFYIYCDGVLVGSFNIPTFSLISGNVILGADSNSENQVNYVKRLSMDDSVYDSNYYIRETSIA